MAVLSAYASRVRSIRISIAVIALVASTAAGDVDPFQKPLLYPVTGEPLVKRDVVYRIDGAARLLADVYRPRLRRGVRRPVVVFVHGGPITAGMPPSPKDWRIYRDYGRLLASRGFVAVTFNHRLTRENDYATSAADVGALLDYVRTHAAELSADPDRLVVWAFSGGGPLLGAVMDRPNVRALVSYYAFLDGPPGLSPIERVRAGGLRVPVLVLRAGRDVPEINASVKRFLDEALAHDVSIELINHPTGVHAFDILTDDPRTREVIRRTIEFVRDRTR